MKHSLRAALLTFLLSSLSACSSSPSGSSTSPIKDADGTGGGRNAGAAAVSDAGGTGTADSGTAPVTGTTLTGKLGALGDALPTVSSFVISNSGETLIYMSSAMITCDMIKTSRWLSKVAAGAQVIEIVMPGSPAAGATVKLPPGEVNYAAGGKSSSYEKGSLDGSFTFSEAAVKGAVEGTVTATLETGDTLSGTFKAEFCDGGQGF